MKTRIMNVIVTVEYNETNKTSRIVNTTSYMTDTENDEKTLEKK